MKLIIDISEKDYNNIEPYLNGQTIKGGFNLFKALEIIKNGIPLDEVIAEIAENICLTDNPYTNETKYTVEHLKLLEIFDSIDKKIGNYTYDPHKSVVNPPITVGELVKILNGFPQDMSVGINYDPHSEIEIGIMTWADGNYPYKRPDFDYVNIQ